MAKSRPTSVEQDAAALRWPRTRLADALATQLAQGDEIAQALGAITRTWTEPSERTIAADIENAVGATPSRWHDRNRTILRQAFTTAGVLDEYDPDRSTRLLYSAINAARSELSVVRLTHDNRLGRLRGVAERIDLYDRATGDAASDLSELEDVFVVHGRDDATKNEVARTLHQLLGREAVILHEQPDGGATIIEKFEHHANMAAAAVVILSPDDVGGLAPGDSLHPRARQNVVYELGWFHARLGRGQVLALLVDEVEKPSDISGVLYVAKDPGGAWKTVLARELRNAGLPADANNLRL